MARQADDSFVCFGAKPDKGFWTWDLAVSGSGNGTWEERGTKELDRLGYGTRTRAVGTGHRSREAGRHEIGSSDSEDDQVKMSRHSSCFVEFSLVIHASISLYMLSEMQCYITPCLALELTPSILFVLFVCSLTSHSLDCIWCSGKEMCVAPIETTSWSPAVKKWNG